MLALLLIAQDPRITEVVRDDDVAVIQYEGTLTATVIVRTDQGDARVLASTAGAVAVALPAGAKSVTLGGSSSGEFRRPAAADRIEGLRVDSDGTVSNDSTLTAVVIVRDERKKEERPTVAFLKPGERRRFSGGAIRILSLKAGAPAVVRWTPPPGESGWRVNLRTPAFRSIEPYFTGMIARNLELDIDDREETVRDQATEIVHGFEFREKDVDVLGFGVRAHFGLLTVTGALYWGQFEGEGTATRLIREGSFVLGQIETDFRFEGRLFGWTLAVGWPAIEYADGFFEFAFGIEASVLQLREEIRRIEPEPAVDATGDETETSFGVGLPVTARFGGVTLELVPVHLFGDAEGWIVRFTAGYEIRF